MKFRYSIILFFVLFVSLSNSVIAQSLQIPVLVGQTGASAIFGKNERDAYTLAVEEWNGKGGVKGQKVELKFEDTQTSAKQMISAFYFLSSLNSPVFLGPTWLDGFQAVIPVARKANVLLVTPSAAIEAFSKENKDWPISFYHNSTLEIKVLLKELKEKGLSRTAIVYEQEPFAEMIKKLVVAESSELLSEIGVQSGEVEFQSQLIKLKNKKPDSLIVFVWNERSLLSLLQQVRIHLPDVQLVTVHDGEGWLKNPAFNTVLPRLMYSKFVLSDRAFDVRFKARFGYEPILTASNAYDALNSVLAALDAGATSSTEIRKYLLETELTTTTFGKFKFAEDGSVPSKVEVINYKR